MPNNHNTLLINICCRSAVVTLHTLFYCYACQTYTSQKQFDNCISISFEIIFWLKFLVMDAEILRFRSVFQDKLNAFDLKDNCVLIKNLNEYNLLIEKVVSAKSKTLKTTSDYRKLKRFDILSLGDIQKLIAPSDDGNIKYYVHLEEIF